MQDQISPVKALGRCTRMQTSLKTRQIETLENHFFFSQRKKEKLNLQNLG